MPGPTKILVVDDEPDLESLIRMTFRRELREGTYDFCFAGDGHEALACFDAIEDVEIVLTDLNMPRMDGLTLLAHLLERERLFKAIVVSAYSDLKNIRSAMNRGSFDFLTKPLDLDDLVITVRKAREALDQQRAAARARDAFGRYLSPQVAASLLAHPDALQFGGEKREVTMLMSDVRGFSMISERLAPERVVELLNVYLAAMADVITRFHGTIDEFIGDAIFVLFGAPLQQPDDATRAVACALAMQREMEAVNALLADRDLPALEMGIGVHTGEVVVGNIGSVKRAKYGAVGSNVNLTSRIESYTIGGQVLVSEATRRATGNAVEVVQELVVVAKGLSEPMRIYEVTAVGGGYDIALPVAHDPLVPLPQPWPFRYAVLEGAHIRGSLQNGVFIQQSATGAVTRLEGSVQLLDNLRLTVLDPQDASTPLGDLYAKVVAVQPGEVHLRFTAVPEALARAFGRVHPHPIDPRP